MHQGQNPFQAGPLAPGNTTTAGNYTRPGSAPGSNIRPVARAAGVGRGRGQPPTAMATGGEPMATGGEPMAMGRTVVRKEVPQDPEEDEETRQYRMKIEEQKRVREQVLRRKEMRRQLQAGVRKKELLDRLNAQGPTQLPGLNPEPAQGPPQGPHPGPLQQQHHHQQQQQQVPPTPRAQRQFPFKQQQQGPAPNQGPVFTPNGALQNTQPCPPVRPRLQPGMAGVGPNQQRQIPQQHQQQQQQQHQQQHLQHQQSLQRRNSGQAFQQPQPPQRIMPIQGVCPAGPGPLQSLALGPKLGVKRTVMQRSRSLVGDEVPEKVRIVKLPGAHGRVPEPPCSPEHMTIPSLTQGAHRKVMHAGAMATQTPGGWGGASRVLVSGGRGGGRGGAGRGRVPRAQQGPECQLCTVSIEGLSSSTTDAQIKNLLHSIGPIQMFTMLPQQRKAVARFSSPQHASSFQKSFNRHMIDLSHIDVSLIDG
ncbi:hypothetical protein CRUP_030788 [Coryphaenoides rupestris]|nr:hypothetical protein CRUP_030788 [Coryphaenoides rupestris]